MPAIEAPPAALPRRTSSTTTTRLGGAALLAVLACSSTTSSRPVDAGPDAPDASMDGAAGADATPGLDVPADDRPGPDVRSTPDAGSTPDARGAFEPSAACVQRVESLLGQMTLDEKIGQVLLVERRHITPDDVARFGVGGVLSAGGSGPADNSPTGWADETDRFRATASGSRLHVPILYGIDAVHGLGGLRGATVFPHNVGVGAAGDAALAEQIGRITAAETAAVGMNFVFGPMVAVARNDHWGRQYESYGETAELPGAMGAATIRGLQGASLGEGPFPMIACAKHFAGDGGTEGGKDRGDTRGDEAALIALHVEPYAQAVRAGVGAVMASYSSWNGVPGTVDKHLITDVLKGQLGFRGFVVTDFDAIEQTVPGGSLADRYTAALDAGVDMFMTSNDPDEETPGSLPAYLQLFASIVPARVPMARLDDAVGRILAVKCQARLLDAPADRALTAQVGSPEHRAVARASVARSAVLLKNAGGLLPLSRTTPRIHLGGKSADDVGNQCGGWTIEWQGKSGPITPGTTVRKALEDVVGRERVTFAADGSGGAGATVGIAVIGETPYAEWFGDRADLSIAPADLAAVKAMKDAGLAVVVILVTGRPLALGPLLPLADAVLVAWLPGTEAAGLADVLFGDQHPSAKLPQSWPRDVASIPVNVGDARYDPQFPYGFGLGY
jgi:beta-glucosidase